MFPLGLCATSFLTVACSLPTTHNPINQSRIEKRAFSKPKSGGFGGDALILLPYIIVRRYLVWFFDMTKHMQCMDYYIDWGVARMQQFHSNVSCLYEYRLSDKCRLIDKTIESCYNVLMK